MICACGRESPPSATRCVSCGRPLAAAPEAETGVPFGREGDRTVLAAGSEALTDSGGFGAGAVPPAAGGPRQKGPLEIGQAFGRRYHVIKLLGQGGMGAVYQAWDAELGMAVAIKVVRPEIAANPDAAAELERRFKRELVLARQVTHKNVVRIHDLGEIDGIKYITMQFMDGEDLSTVLKRERRLPVPRVVRLARTMVAGLVAAHDAGVVHRDLKPANIMVDADDEAIIMDFGIARSAGGPVVAGASAPAPGAGSFPGHGARAAYETVLGSIVGTVEYMAPEQARGLPVDQRADVYAFGLIVRDMLLGRNRVPEPAGALAELQGRMAQAPASPRSIDPGVPERLDRLVARCLAPDPAARYQTTREVAAELDRLDAAGLPLPVYRRVTPRLAVAAGGLVVALLAGTWWFSQSQAPAVQPDPVSVLVADFTNGPQDPLFDGVLEQALGIEIERASFITAYPRRDARRLAADARPGRPFDEEAARLVSLREGVKIVLAGAIEARGSGYVISVKVVDPAADTLLATATVTASTKPDVLRAIGSLAVRVRGELGDVAPDTGGAETLTATVLDAVRDYSQAQDLAQAGKDSAAIELYQKAIARDPNFGRAYSGLATSAFKTGQTAEAEEAWNKALSLMDRMTEREKLRTMGTYFLGRARNYDKAIDNYEQLVRLYPADGAGHNNLAIAYFSRLDFRKALEEGGRVRDIYPKKLLYRGNYALYAMYAGDFQTATSTAAEVIKEDPKYFKAYLPLAMSALVTGSTADAGAAYDRMATAGPGGASLAAIGRADLAMYEGRYGDAERILKAGITEDDTAKNTRGMAAKYVALGETYAALRRAGPGADAITRALALSRDAQAAAAAVLLDVGRASQAAAIGLDLASQLQPQSRAHAKIIEARIALRERKTVQAVEALTAAIKLADLWTARYLLGVAYIEAGHGPEGLAELDACMRRRGEAVALFLDDVPSGRVLAPLKYWLARAQQDVGQVAGARDNYTAFLALRTQSPEDPLVRDARRRLKALSP